MKSGDIDDVSPEICTDHFLVFFLFDQVSFTALFKHLTVDTILKIFGAVLLERRILFTAQHLR